MEVLLSLYVFVNAIEPQPRHNNSYTKNNEWWIVLEQFWLKNEQKKFVGWPSKVGCVFLNTHELMMGSLMTTRSMVIYHNNEKCDTKINAQLNVGKRIQRAWAYDVFWEN